MDRSEKTRSMLTKHFQDYPEMQIQDLFKYIFHSSFGCEHLISSLEKATDYIQKEYDGLTESGVKLTEPLDGEYSRVHLSYLDQGLSVETLGKIFFLSAKKETDGLANLEEKLDVARSLSREGILPFSPVELDDAINKWRSLGYPAIHHSDIFRAKYTPAYRVISNHFAKFLPLFAKIDRALQGGSVAVAIDGGSASGKTTLGEILLSVYDCNIIHMDDFFLRPHQRTPERLSEVGGNIDRERFLEEILIPHSQNLPISYRKFDCSTMSLSSPIDVPQKRLTIIEGAYSMHPALAEYYNLSVFLDISPEFQRQRIKKRNSPQMAERFFGEWIPLEQIYFEKTDIRARSDLSISINE